MSDEGKYYISITGLRLKRKRDLFRFMWHSIRCAKQAKAADGNIDTKLTKFGDDQHTLTVWDSRKAMLAFMHSGAHRRALAIFDEIATGKTFGFASDTVPDWRKARALWEKHGREYRAPSERNV